MFIIDDIIIWGLGIEAGSVAAATVTMGTLAMGVGVGVSTYQSSQQKKAQKSAEKKQAQAKQEQLSYQRYLIGEQANLTKEQMLMQMNQRKIGDLSDLVSKTEPAPRILTLPSAPVKRSIVDDINLQIHKFLQGR